MRMHRVNLLALLGAVFLTAPPPALTVNDAGVNLSSMVRSGSGSLDPERYLDTQYDEVYDALVELEDGRHRFSSDPHRQPQKILMGSAKAYEANSNPLQEPMTSIKSTGAENSPLGKISLARITSAIDRLAESQVFLDSSAEALQQHMIQRLPVEVFNEKLPPIREHFLVAPHEIPSTERGKVLGNLEDSLAKVRSATDGLARSQNILDSSAQDLQEQMFDHLRTERGDSAPLGSHNTGSSEPATSRDLIDDHELISSKPLEFSIERLRTAQNKVDHMAEELQKVSAQEAHNEQEGSSSLLRAYTEDIKKSLGKELSLELKARLELGREEFENAKLSVQGAAAVQKLSQSLQRTLLSHGHEIISYKDVEGYETLVGDIIAAKQISGRLPEIAELSQEHKKLELSRARAELALMGESGVSNSGEIGQETHDNSPLSRLDRIVKKIYPNFLNEWDDSGFYSDRAIYDMVDANNSEAEFLENLRKGKRLRALKNLKKALHFHGEAIKNQARAEKAGRDGGNLLTSDFYGKSRSKLEKYKEKHMDQPMASQREDDTVMADLHGTMNE